MSVAALATPSRKPIRMTYYPVGAAKEFIAARDPEVLIEGPAGCVAGETRLFNPVTGKHDAIQDLYERQEAPTVLTLAGPVKATVPFLKGVARLYRVTLRSGHSFVVTGHHRVLTPNGWTHVSALQVGSRLLASPQILPESNSDDDASMSRQDVRDWTQTLGDSTGHCSLGRHRCGQPLPLGAGNDRAALPSRADAHEHIRVGPCAGDLASSEARIHLHPESDRLARTDCSLALSDPISRTGSHVAPGMPRCDDGLRRSDVTSQTVTLPQQRAFEAGPGFASTFPSPEPWSIRPLGSSGTSSPDSTSHLPLSPSQWLSWSERTTPESVPFALESGACIPWACDSSSLNYTPLKVQWDTVRSLEFERFDAYFDLHVPGEEHYLAEGYWHHNTGKTYAAMQKLHLTARKYPKARILMVRQTAESLKTGALNTYIKHVRPELDGVVAFGGSKFYPAEFRYPNGSVIIVGGLDKADKFMSAEYDVIFVNEGTETTEDTWQALKTRIRNGVVPYQQLLTDCNPAGPRHWLNQRCNAGKTRRIRSTHRDNPAFWDLKRGDWTPQGREYVEQTLGGLTGVRRQRLLEGVWSAAEGQVYTEFDPERHQRTTVKYPVYGIVPDGAFDTTHCTTYMAVDVGSRNPTAILTAHHREYDDWLHISHEVYRRGMTSTDILDAIKAEADRCDPYAIYIDPSAKAYIDDLHRAGYPAAPAVNDVLVGIQRVHGVLARGFSVDPSCTNLIDEFGMYSYPDKPKIETDKPVKEFDHALDALRYCCMGVFGDVATQVGSPSDDLADYLAAQ